MWTAETERLEKSHSFALARAIFVVILLEGIVLTQAVLSYRDGFLSVSQMQGKVIDYGLPFLWHFGMWGDAFIISGLSAFVVGRYSRQWRVIDTILSGVFAFIISAFMSWTYTFSIHPEAHVRDRRLTQVGLIHLIYMTIALTILIQFLFRTRQIRPVTIVTVSSLLLAHVLLGTHMVLGVIKWFAPLKWYPGRPLRSIGGWTIIGGVSVFLLYKTLSIAGFLGRLERAVNSVLRTRFAKYAITYIIKFLMVEEPDDIEGFIKFLDRLCKWVGIGAFFTAGIKYLTQANPDWRTSLLIFLIGCVFVASRHSVRTELVIGKKVFPPGRVPQGWGTPRDWLITALLVMAFMVLYLTIAWFADNIVIVTFCMFLIACNDFRTRSKIGEGISAFFADPRYAPGEDDLGYAVIQARREVVVQYLFGKPHRAKEGGRVLGCGGAYVLAMAGYLYGDARLTS